jgi:hypothetical protein
MTITVLDPTAEGPAAAAEPAPPLPTLQGARIGILDNGKIRVDRFCDFVEEVLRSQYGVADVVRRRKPNASAPAPHAVLADLLACDGVISAVGD